MEMKGESHRAQGGQECFAMSAMTGISDLAAEIREASRRRLEQATLSSQNASIRSKDRSMSCF
jgi:hypothetical protein